MTVPPSPQSVVNIVENKIGGRKNCCVGVTKWINETWKAVLSEFVCTTLLLLVGCMTTIPIDGLPFQSPLYAPIGFGFIVMVNIQIFGHISGALMNPSVTLAALLWGKLSIATTIGYIFAQLAGAVLGYAILIGLSPVDLISGGVCVSVIDGRLGMVQAVAIEALLTTVLNFVNCSFWDPVNKNMTSSLAIKFGLTVAGLSIAGGPLTGASMNPARSFGPAALTGSWINHWVHWVGPIIGAVVPTMVYKYTWLKKEENKAEVQSQDNK